MKKGAKPLSLFKLQKTYPGKAEAGAYLECSRWGDSRCCSRCGATDGITQQKDKAENYWCKYCRKYFNAWTGMRREDGKVELPKWIYAAYLPTTARKSISSLQLSKELEVTQATAWYILHRLRIACGSNMEALHGTVEVDEVYLGGGEENKHESKKAHGQHFAEKQIVLGMRKRGGRTVAMPIEQADTAWCGSPPCSLRSHHLHR